MGCARPVSHVILDLVEAQSGIALAFEQTDEAALLEAARAPTR
jgi:hypothetical protein